MTLRDVDLLIRYMICGCLGYIQPVNYVNAAGLSQYYCDGGLVCNFPLHCFDGKLTFFGNFALSCIQPPFDYKPFFALGKILTHISKML